MMKIAVYIILFLLVIFFLGSIFTDKTSNKNIRKLLLIFLFLVVCLGVLAVILFNHEKGILS